MINQNLSNLPAEILQQPRFFPVNDDKRPKIKDWNNPANQKKFNLLDLPVGFVITANKDKPSPFSPNYLTFDFDHVWDDKGKFVSENARTVYEQIRAIGTYGEISQSGHGFHFILNPTMKKFTAMGPAKLYLDDRTDLPENQRAKLEVFYKTDRYFIFTGNKIQDSPDVIIKGQTADQLIEDILSQIEAQKPAKVKTNDVSTDTLPPATTSEPQSSSFDTKQPTELERAEDMLNYIDPAQCSYDEWLNVGIIIKNLGGTLELWDTWSSRDEDRYSNGKKGQSCHDKWGGFTEDGSLTIATLHDMAKQGGYSEAEFQRQWHKEHGTSYSHDASDVQADTPTNNVLVVNMKDYLSSQYSEDLKNFQSVSKIKTGLDNLDKTIGGVSPGLYVLGAIPSLGKTTLIHQFADNMAIAGYPVLFFSLEQTPMELASKSIARESFKLNRESEITAWALQNNFLTNENRQLAVNAFNRYSSAVADRLNIIPGIHSISLDDIISIVEKFIAETGKTPVVIIDYLQIISLDGMNSDKMRIDRITSSLKQLQSRNDLALFVISSFNRSNYMQVVDYESFKESGHIEYSADAIWGLQLQVLGSDDFKALDAKSGSGVTSRKRELVDDAKRQQPRKIELKALKHRNHPLYSVGFIYHSARDFFEPDPNYGKAPAEETPVEEQKSDSQTNTVSER